MPQVMPAQKGKGLPSEDPIATRSITVLGVPQLPGNQRAVVYVRPERFPGVLVVIREHGSTPEDLAAGYELALRAVDPDGVYANKGRADLSPMRAVIGPSQIKPLRGDVLPLYARYLAHLGKARHMTVDGVGSGPLIRIAKRTSSSLSSRAPKA